MKEEDTQGGLIMFRRPVFVQFNPAEIRHLVLQLMNNYTNLAQIYSYLLTYNLDQFSLYLLNHMQDTEFNSLQNLNAYFISNYGMAPQIGANKEEAILFTDYVEGINTALRYKANSIEVIRLILDSMPEDYAGRALFEDILVKDYEHQDLLNALLFHSLHA